MEFLFDGDVDSPLIVFAHGAGAPMNSGFMAAFAIGLGERGLRVARFEFPTWQRAGRQAGVVGRGRNSGPVAQRLLEVAGEAAAQVPADPRERYRLIPW